MTTIPAAAHRMTTMTRVEGRQAMTTRAVDHRVVTTMMMTIHQVMGHRATMTMMTTIRLTMGHQATIRPAVAHPTMTTTVESAATVREPARSWTV